MSIGGTTIIGKFSAAFVGIIIGPSFDVDVGLGFPVEAGEARLLDLFPSRVPGLLGCGNFFAHEVEVSLVVGDTGVSEFFLSC